MTQASLKSQWSETEKGKVHKQILSAVEAAPGITYLPLFKVCGLTGRTGTARLSELTDMGLVVVRGNRTERIGSRNHTYSRFNLSYLGHLLMGSPNKDEILAAMNKARREQEEQRADAMREIRKNHVSAVRQAVRDTAHFAGLN